MSQFRFEQNVLKSAIRFVFDIKRNFFMAKHEVVGMFGATTFGALWQPIALAVNIFGIGVIFGALFDLPVERYVPFLCIGIILWNAITSLIPDCADSLNNGDTPNTPYHMNIIFPIRVCSKHVLLSLINFSIYVVVAIIFSKSVTIGQLFFFFCGLFCFFWILVFAGILCSIIGAFFKDFSNIIRNLLNLMFFITPVMWEPGGISKRWIFELNPLYHLIEMVRAPLIAWETYNAWVLVSMMGFGIIFAFISLICWAGFAWMVPYKR